MAANYMFELLYNPLLYQQERYLGTWPEYRSQSKLE
jgi:hypothetical protein